jgi:maltose O-acetyltransferase
MKITRVPGPLRNAQRYRDKGVKVGRGTYIYRTCTISTSVCDDITIGSGCVLTGCAILAHDASLKRHIGRVIASPVVIGNNCFIGFNSTILKGVKIGDNSIIGAGAVVTKDVPANSVAAGNPARVICSVEKLAAKYRQA